MHVQGIYPALLTFFDDNLEVNYDAMEEHIEFIIQKGVQGIFALGTTGEGMLLSLEKRKEIAKEVIGIVNDRVPVIVHVGEQTTNKVIELANHAESVGASAISAISPYFFPVDDESVYNFFSEISNSVSPDFALYLYNNPRNAGNEISLENILKLEENHDNIRGIKYSPADFKYIIDMVNEVPNDFPIMLGMEHYFFPGLCIGTSGGISDIANIYPELFTKVFQSFKAGDLTTAREAQVLINRASAIFQGSISKFKYGLEFRGFPPSTVNEPLREITRDEKLNISNKLEELHKQIDKLFEN